MKKLHGCPSFFLTSRNAALAMAFLTGISLFLITSCDLFGYKRNFPDAYYENNFIADIGFDKFVAVTTPLPIEDPLTNEPSPVSGEWDFAWRYSAYDATEVPYEYMTLSEVTEATYETAGATGYGPPPAGLLSASVVYRLDLKNLITDGDFEGVTPLANWATTGTPPEFSVISGEGAINGYSLTLKMIESAQTATYTMVIPAAAQAADNSYVCSFFFAPSAPNSTNATGFLINGSQVTFNPAGFAVTDFQLAGTNTFNITGKDSSSFELVIDDIRVKRNLANSHLRLLLSPSQTNPPLMNLLYRFSLWVHEDPLVPVTPAPYHLDSMSITFAQLQTAQINSMSVNPGTYAYLKNSGWRKIVAEVSVEGNPQFPEDSITPVFELIIDLSNSSPGSVLIAQPELRSYPDGY